MTGQRLNGGYDFTRSCGGLEPTSQAVFRSIIACNSDIQYMSGFIGELGS